MEHDTGTMDRNAGTMDHSTGTMHQGMQYDKMRKNTQGGVDMKELGMMEGSQDRSTMYDRAAN